MTRSRSEIELVLELADRGLNNCEISRRTGIPRRTIGNWRQGRIPGGPDTRTCHGTAACISCSGYRTHAFPAVTKYSYAYLLGLYLGDGWLTRHARSVYQLHVALDRSYPLIVAECAAAVSIVMPRNAVAVVQRRDGRVDEVRCYSRHWTCLFPQHGSGLKHERGITLADWQGEIANRYPWRFLRGLIQSDGSRFMNPIKHPKRTYVYPRYTFSNRSDDIRNLFCEHCDKVGVEWRQMNRWNISVAQRESVALMDRYIGPKR